MRNFEIAFVLSTIAGLSTFIGTLLVFVKKINKNLMIISSLSFASGVMFFLSFTDLIPEGFKFLTNYYTELFSIILSFVLFVLGVCVSFTMDKIMPSLNCDNNKLYKIGIFSMIVIAMHNIPEGMITFITSSKDTLLGLKLVISIALHNIPEGISIALPIYYSTGSKRKAFLYTFISAVSEPLGALITFLFLRDYISNLFMGLLLNLVGGIMIYIALYELLPTSFKYKKKKLSIVFFLLGIIFVSVCGFLF